MVTVGPFPHLLSKVTFRILYIRVVVHLDQKDVKRRDCGDLNTVEYDIFYHTLGRV